MDAVVFAVRHMLLELPPSWPITILHGPGNRAFVHEHFAPEVATGRVRTWEFYGIPVGLRQDTPGRYVYSHERWNNTLAFARSESGAAAVPPRAEFHSANTPTAVMTNLALYSTRGLVPSERFLFFQTDGLLCGGQFARLEPLLHYDWVGALWNMSERWYSSATTSGVGGNGGLSLRSRSACLRALNHVGASRTDGNDWMQGSEDLVFFRALKATGAVLPSAGVAGRFAVETRWDTTRTPMGFHATWRYHDDLAALFDYCPAAEVAHSFSQGRGLEYTPDLLRSARAPRHAVDVDATLPGAPE